MARTTGALYIIVILAAAFAEAGVRGRLVASGDATATAANIMAHETLYRLGGAADLLNLMCDVGVGLLLYALLKVVSRPLAQVATAFRLVGDTVLACATVAHFGPLILLGGQPYLNVFTKAQLHAEALSYLRLQAQGYNVAMVFFGCGLAVLGVLVWRSTFFPRALGPLVTVSGLCYVANSYIVLTAPGVAPLLSPYIFLPGLIAEVSITLCLLFGGVDAKRWSEARWARDD